MLIVMPTKRLEVPLTPPPGGAGDSSGAGPPPAERARLPHWQRTDIGRRRQRNEDSMLVDAELGLFAVADGMGGHASGDVASSEAVRVVAESLRPHHAQIGKLADPNDREARVQVEKLLSEAVRAANAAIHQQAQELPGKSRMGTTFCGGLLTERQALIANVGDSRAYLARAGQLYQLTQDHSLVNEQVRRGIITREQAERSPHRNVLLKALGIEPIIDPDIVPVDLCDGDRLLLCTDGVYRDLSTGALGQLMGETDGGQVVQAMIDEANAAGGLDNATAVLIDIIDGDHNMKGAGNTTDHVVAPQAKMRAMWRLSLFQHLDYAELCMLVGLTTPRVFRPGEIVFAQKEPGNTFLVVIEGALEVSSGGKVLTAIAPGEHVGELALMDGSPRSATVIARERTKVLCITRDDFHGLIQREPLLASKLLWRFGVQMAARIRELTERLRAQQS